MEDFSRPLLDWYCKNARPLPWREDRDPYRVWVSEIMLQQTRIEAARDYYTRFMAALPTLEALAGASEETVLTLWEGLGYYSRARNLRKCAVELATRHGGQFPETAAELRKLPGIGDYTAGAIASIAFGENAPAVDGNAVRVLTRLTRCGESAGDDKLKSRFRRELAEICPPGECGEFNSAIMELGETVCTPGTPDCRACPLANLCQAHAAGEETAYPVLPAKKPRRIEARRVLLMVCGDKVALRRRPDRGLLAGLWEFPNDALPDAPPGGEPCGEAVHVFTHVEWHMRGYVVRCETEDPAYTWVTRAERRALAMPSAFRYYAGVCDRLQEEDHDL